MERPSIERFRPLWNSWGGMPQLFIHQLGWWACVLWKGFAGPVVMAIFLLIHLYVERKNWKREVNLILVSAVVGLSLDSTLAFTGLVSYVGEQTLGLVPLWLIAIWAGFGATVLHSQAVLFQTRRVALLTGLLGGPLAYAGGVRLECMEVAGLTGFLGVSLLWAIAMVLLQWIGTLYGGVPNNR
jgi:hypothetical protein